MKDMTVEIKTPEKEEFPFTEALKTLRTNIQFSGPNIRVIMFTSAIPGEGKSRITFSEASSLAELGRKVLLIDADIRKSVLLNRYRVRQEVSGLSEYLSGQKMLDEILYSTNIPNLDIIFAGPYSPNPSELLAEEAFKALIREMRAVYDYILIDTPPMAGMTDGAIVAQSCDGAILVIESGAVSRKIEKRVKEQLEKSGCRILGAVLNKVDMKSGSYYGKQYGKYYGKYYDDKDRS